MNWLHSQVAPSASMSSHEINWRVREIERGLKREGQRLGPPNEGDFLKVIEIIIHVLAAFGDDWGGGEYIEILLNRRRPGQNRVRIGGRRSIPSPFDLTPEKRWRRSPRSKSTR